MSLQEPQPLVAQGTDPGEVPRVFPPKPNPSVKSLVVIGKVTIRLSHAAIALTEAGE